MAQQGRFFRPKEQSLIGTKYDSRLELKLDQLLTNKLSQMNSQESNWPENESTSTVSSKTPEQQSEADQSPLNGPSIKFHVSKVKYTIEKTYNPDFTLAFPDGREIFIEAKGYFQDAQEVQKYEWVRESLDEKQELVFCFENPAKPIHFRSKRKDGTRMCHGEWADKNGFRHFTLENVGELLT